MGWSLGDIAATVGTGGAYGVYKVGRDSQNNDEQNAYDQNLYNQNQKNWDRSMDLSKQLEEKTLGDSAKTVGKDATDYKNMLYSKMNTPTISSDMYRKKADLNLSRANAKAGLAGMDTTAGMQQEGRNAQSEATAMNEDYKNKAMQQYGQSVGATQNAVANLWLGTMGMATGSQQTPQPLQRPGLIGGITKDLGLA